jgi:hypothetical protein
MTVTEHFHLERVGLFIRPDFSVPPGGWSDREAEISIRPPSGEDFQALAVFHLSHFRIADPDVSIDLRWRVTLCLPDTVAEQVPVGSLLFAPSDVCSVLSQQSQPST